MHMGWNQLSNDQNGPDAAEVKKILADIQPREGVRSAAETQVVRLTYGGKVMDLQIAQGGDVFEIQYLEKNESAERKPRETTLLHIAAKEYAQRIVDRRGTPSRFQTRTDNDTVLAWLRGPGERMFKWEKEFITTPSSHEHLVVFYTHIFPRKPEKSTDSL